MKLFLDHVLLYWVTKFRILFLANCTIISFSSVILPPGWLGKIYYFFGLDKAVTPPATSHHRGHHIISAISQANREKFC